MKRFLIVVGYAVGGLVLAGVVSLGAFAVTTRQLSETPEPIVIGHTASVAPTADGGGQGGGGNGQGDATGDWKPSWSPTLSPSDSPSDDPSPGETTIPRARAPATIRRTAARATTTTTTRRVPAAATATPTTTDGFLGSATS